ncbi:MAG: hypothetical protein GY705_31490 [Bacteroidetes bacterium]|nr:hypothetical protein [Bacteroidota bacterium]
MKNNRGVSVLELIICLSIISILGGISTPAFIKHKDNIILKAEVRKIVECLHKAKIEAIKTNSSVVFHLDGRNYSVFVDDGEGTAKKRDWIRQSEERQIYSGQVSKGITVSSNFPYDRMRFNGRVGIKAGRYYIQNNSGKRMQVVLNVNGRVRIGKS